MTDTPWLGDACSLVDAFRAGERTPLEELDAALTAIEASDLNAFSSNTLNTISNFDTTYGHGGHLQLYPVGNNGSINTTAGLVRLAHFNSGTYARTFQIGFYFPAPNNTNQNTLQGLQSTFGLTWHIEQ